MSRARISALIECVANFSEGRDEAVVGAIAESIACQPGVCVLHRTQDPDHHRSVITFAGAPSAVAAAALQAVKTARDRINLNLHQGVHPRLGAADVVPLVPVRNITLAECAALARTLGEQIWTELGIPVYFYEAAAATPARTRLENVRRGGFEGVREAVATDPSRLPDIGGPNLHPTAGAVIVGARKLLIAWNVNLATSDLSVARDIARTIRASSGGLRNVKALGLPLESRGQVQVSVNLTDFEVTPLHVVYEAICREARKWKVEVAGTEIIGLMPRAAIEAAAEAYLRMENFHSAIVLENRLEKIHDGAQGDKL